ncbi:TIGR02679 family protein [Caballeronia sp. 15715]|uniref:TIGR02679 family protein n=1 Tax=Caballeronia sp. 15715 TaxID=3391030 RepID=UPI0039E357F3
MTAPVDARLERLLGGPMLSALRRRLRRTLGSREAGERAAAFRMTGLSPHEHEILASLMGKKPSISNSILLEIDLIDTALRRAGVAESLRNALEQLDGPIVHAPAVRAEAQARWADVAADALHEGLAGCLRTPLGMGLLKRLARQDPAMGVRLRERADAVLKRLPAAGLPRAQLAAQTLGDAHALDEGQPTASLVLAAWRQHEGRSMLPDAEDAFDTPPGDERIRDVWARAGVLINELARPVLFMNLPMADGFQPLSPAGEPGYASLRMLLRSPPRWAARGHDIFVCENPNLVAIAADQLGRHCAPLICTDGMPAAAQRALLGQIVNEGGQLLYHGDFDWAGVPIANYMMRVYGARPWRFTSADYKTAVEKHARSEHRLAGSIVEAFWDTALAPSMREHGQAFAEEGLSEELLGDLAR